MDNPASKVSVTQMFPIKDQGTVYDLHEGLPRSSRDNCERTARGDHSQSRKAVQRLSISGDELWNTRSSTVKDRRVAAVFLV